MFKRFLDRIKLQIWILKLKEHVFLYQFISLYIFLLRPFQSEPIYVLNVQ